MKGQIKKIIILAIIILQIILASYVFVKESAHTNVCSINQVDSCGNVVNSAYGSLFGIKISLWGIVAFSILFLVGLFAFRNKLFFGMMILGSVIALILMVIQAFILRQFCLFCVTIDSLMIINFGLYLFLRK